MDDEERETRGELGWVYGRAETYAAMRQPDGDVWVRRGNGWTRVTSASKLAKTFKGGRTA